MDSDTLQAAVRSNATKSALLVAGFPFVLPTVIFVFALVGLGIFGNRNAAGIATSLFVATLIAMVVVTVVWLPIGYLINQWVIDKATKARLLGRNEEPQLWSLFERLCATCGMRLPALRIIETDVMNAYASGLREGSYSVTVTRGLIVALSDDELAGVLAHELTHIRNHDVRLLVVATVLVGTIPMIHDIVMKGFWAVVMGILGFYRAVFSVLPVPLAKTLAELSYSALFWVGKLVAYVIGFVGTVSSLVIHFALSRKREFMADAGAVDITGNPEAMISALRKISGNSTLDTTIDGVRAMMFDNSVFGLGGLFATHPPIKQRIEAIARLGRPIRKRMPAETTITEARPSPSRPAAAPSTPALDPVTVDRYRTLLLRARPEALDAAARQQLYRRAREAVQKGKQLNVAIADTQLATAELCLEEAIRQVEADILGGRVPPPVLRAER